MSRAFITNMNSFIDDKGAVLESTPKRAKRFGQHLGTIVAYVTEQPKQVPKKAIFCWNKINRKNCSGKIDAGIELGNFDILWHCLKCGDHGSINHWEHTVWDGTYR